MLPSLWAAASELPATLQHPDRHHYDCSASYRPKPSTSFGISTITSGDGIFLDGFHHSRCLSGHFLVPTSFLRWGRPPRQFSLADLPFETSLDLCQGCDHHWQLTLPWWHFRHFLASRRPDTIEYHPIHVPLAEANILIQTLTKPWPPSSPAMSPILVAISPFSSTILANRRLDFVHHLRFDLFCRSGPITTPASPLLVISSDGYYCPVWCLINCVRVCHLVCVCCPVVSSIFVYPPTHDCICVSATCLPNLRPRLPTHVRDLVH